MILALQRYFVAVWPGQPCTGLKHDAFPQPFVSCLQRFRLSLFPLSSKSPFISSSRLTLRRFRLRLASIHSFSPSEHATGLALHNQQRHQSSKHSENMVGKLLTFMAAVAGAMAQTTVVAPAGSTVIIIATNAGGGASWQNVNPPMSGMGMEPQTHQVCEAKRPGKSKYSHHLGHGRRRRSYLPAGQHHGERWRLRPVQLHVPEPHRHPVKLRHALRERPNV